MAVLQALIALIARSTGRILNAVFGWAVHALFGRTAPRDQTLLSAILGAAAAWPLLVLGVAAPKVAAFVLAFVPFVHAWPAWIVRVVWLALALAVPLALGLAVAWRGRTAEPLPKRLLRGFPLTLALAIAFLILFVSVPIMRAAALVRREKSADIPLATDAATYHRVARLIEQTLRWHDLAVVAAQPGWWVTAPTRVLALFGGSAFRGFVPERLEHYEGSGLTISFYPSAILLRAKGPRFTLAHGLIEETVVHSDGLQTFAPHAQELERRVREVWKIVDGDPFKHEGSPRLLARVEQLALDLAALDVDYDQWQVLYRQIMQLDRAVRGELQLLAYAAFAETRRAMTSPPASAQGSSRA